MDRYFNFHSCSTSILYINLAANTDFTLLFNNLSEKYSNTGSFDHVLLLSNHVYEAEDLQLWG